MDFFNSFFQNVKDKLTSPFFGTLSFIIIFHHWEFWYSLFNFDKECTRIEKLAILRSLASDEFTFKNLSLDVGFAILFVLIGYAVVFSTRALSLAFDHKAMTWLTEKVVSKEVVLLDTHKAIFLEMNSYAEQYEEQRQRVRTFSKNLDEQTKQIQDKDDFILSEGKKINSLNNQIAQVELDLNYEKRTVAALTSTIHDRDARLIKMKQEFDANTTQISKYEESLDFYRMIFIANENKAFWNDLKKLPREVIVKAKEIKSKNLWEDFLLFYSIKENGGSYTDKTLNRMIDIGVIHSSADKSLTEIGRLTGTFSYLFEEDDFMM